MLLIHAMVIEYLNNYVVALYVVAHKVIETIVDGTSRARTVNVNLHKQLGAAAYTFRCPKGRGLPNPTARSYAVPKTRVPNEDWHHTPNLTQLLVRVPRIG